MQKIKIYFSLIIIIIIKHQNNFHNVTLLRIIYYYLIPKCSCNHYSKTVPCASYQADILCFGYCTVVCIDLSACKLWIYKQGTELHVRLMFKLM